MRHKSRDTYDWYDEDDAFKALKPEIDPTLAGLPDSWRHYGWWIAGIGFAVLWMLESWTSGGSLSAMAKGLLGLLLTFGLCLSVYQYSKPASERLAHGLTMLIATAMLIAHGLH